MPQDLTAPPDPDDARGVFVSPRGSDTNPGTRAAPLASPAAAIARAQREGRAVFLAAGEYVAELRTSVSLYGGYSEDYREHEPARFVTRVRGLDGGHASTALRVESGSVVLDGLELQGGRAKHATAVTIHGAARATLVDCVLRGGGRGPGPDGFTYSHGIDVPFAEKPVIALRRCRVHGGDNQYAWAIDGLGPECVVEDSTLVGGACATPNSSTYAVRGSGGFVLRGNVIDAGRGAHASGVSLHAGATIERNTFVTPRGDGWSAIVVNGEGALTVAGNTIDGVPDEQFFAFARKLARRRWTYNEVTGAQWSYETVTLDPWGWLHFASDGADEPTGAGYSGPSQSFREFLAQGPAVASLPIAIADEIRAMLRAAGVPGADRP